MLKAWFGEMEGAVYNTVGFFRNSFRPEWMADAHTIEMIRDIDSSTVLGNGAIDSPVLGVIAPERLSGGVKTLILIDHIPEKVFNTSQCGDNCCPWLLRLGKEKDVTINLHHLPDFSEGPFEILVLNTGEVVHTMPELARTAGRFI